MSIQKDFWYKIEDSLYDEKEEEDFRRIRSHVKNEIELEKKYVPEHPYCTNWPITKKKYEQLEFEFEDDFNLTEDQVAPI